MRALWACVNDPEEALRSVRVLKVWRSASGEPRVVAAGLVAVGPRTVGRTLAVSL